MIQLLGFSAAMIGAFAFAPQMIKTWRTRSSGDLSLGMLVALTTAATLWVLYGVAIHAAPVIIGNAITLALSVSLLVLKARGTAGRQTADTERAHRDLGDSRF